MKIIRTIEVLMALGVIGYFAWGFLNSDQFDIANLILISNGALIGFLLLEFLAKKINPGQRSGVGTSGIGLVIAAPLLLLFLILFITFLTSLPH